MHAHAEPWLDKRQLAEHFACSVRSIENALAEGVPHARIFGRPKFRPSQVEPWLEAHGFLVRGGGEDKFEVEVNKRPRGAETPEARTRGDDPHASTEA